MWKGKINSYDSKNLIEFEGELKNGERNGYGKEYEEGRLIYEGEFLDSKRHGKGKEYYDFDDICHLLNKKNK